jgi:hypothetical protein
MRFVLDNSVDLIDIATGGRKCAVDNIRHGKN